MQAKSIKDKELARLDALVAEPTDPGFSIQEFAERYNLTRQSAEARLNTFVSKGKLIQGWRRSATGRRMRVYRFPEDL